MRKGVGCCDHCEVSTAGLGWRRQGTGALGFLLKTGVRWHQMLSCAPPWQLLRSSHVWFGGFTEPVPLLISVPSVLRTLLTVAKRNCSLTKSHDAPVAHKGKAASTRFHWSRPRIPLILASFIPMSGNDREPASLAWARPGRLALYHVSLLLLPEQGAAPDTPFLRRWCWRAGGNTHGPWRLERRTGLCVWLPLCSTGHVKSHGHAQIQGVGKRRHLFSGETCKGKGHT